MSKDVVQGLFEPELQHLDSAIEWAQGGLKHAPEGTLLVDDGKDCIRFYQRKNPADKKGVYLGKKDEDLKRALAQKDYEEQLLKTARKEKALLERMAATYRKRHADNAPETAGDVLTAVYDTLPAARKKLVEPFDLNDDEYALRWLEKEFVSNGHSFGANGLYSRKGQQLRSKSEVIIADLLDANDVPYRYEEALFIGGYSAVYPDFTVLNKRTRAEYVWEHLGAMDDPDYCAQALDKLNRYALAGYLPGDKLIITQESAAVPLDTRVVSALIERYLK